MFLNVLHVKKWQGDLLHILDLFIILWLTFDLLYIRKDLCVSKIMIT